MASATVVNTPKTTVTSTTNDMSKPSSVMEDIHSFNAFKEKQQKNLQERISAVVKEEFSDEEDVNKQVMRCYERALQKFVMKDRPKVSDCAMGVIVAELIEKTDPDFEFSIFDVMILTSWASERLVFADGTSYVDFL